MASWVAEMKARDAPVMAEFNKKIQEGVRLKAVKATEELLEEHKNILLKHEQKVSYRKEQALASLTYWKAQDAVSAAKQKQALEILLSLENPPLTREISRLEKKLKTLGIEVKIPEVEVKIPERTVAVEPLAPPMPPHPSRRTPPFPAEPLPKPQIVKKQIRQIPIHPVTEQKEEAEESTSYAPIILTDAEILREMMSGF